VTLSERSNGSATVRTFQGPNELAIFNRSSRVSSFSRPPTATKLVSQCLRSIELTSQNVRMGNIDCNDTGIPRHQVTRPVDASAYSSLHRR
jgi:hypothetical protein